MATFIVNALDAVLFDTNGDHKDVIHDNLIFTDTATVTSKQTVFLHDGIKISTKGKTVYSVNVYDTVDFVEGPKNIISVNASDNLRLLDASYRIATYQVSLSDEVVFDDDAINRFDFSETVTDNVLFVDNPYPVIPSGVADTANFISACEWALKHPVNDTAVFTDSANINIRYAVEAEDTVEFSEAHKFSLWANASEIVRFLDTTDEVRVRGDAYDEAQFSDHVEVFNRYKETCADELVLSDLIDGEITPYIKWLSDDLVVEDEADFIAHYRIRQREVIGFSDDVTPRLIVHVEESDNISFSDQAHSSVTYGDPLISNSNTATFTDTCSIKISRFVTTEFTNALVAGVGSSELTMYTSPIGAMSTILNISLCNMVAGDISVQVILYKGGVTPFNIRKDLAIGEGESYVINNIQEESIVVEAGDEIRVRSSSPDSLDVFLSVIEQIDGVSPPTPPES